MNAFGWITSGNRRLVASYLRQPTSRNTPARASVPALEPLETIELLSTVVHGLAASAAATKVLAKAVAAVAKSAQVAPPASQSVTSSATLLATTQTTTLQTVTVPDTLTNFTKAFTPPINLFNPSLGTLVAVKVTAQTTLTSQITSENTSTTSGADITGFTNGSYTLTGIGKTLSGNLSGSTATVTVSAFAGGVPNFTGPSTVVFPTLTTSSSLPQITYTDPASLAYFTASTGRTTISPVLTENAQSGANAPNGNLENLVRTSGSGTISVTYEYTAATPPITKVVRYGIHHQPTTLVVTFAGPLDPMEASNPAFYKVVAPNAHGSFTGPGTTVTPIASAVYNAANDTVTLTTVKPINFHYNYQLQVNFPSSNGATTVFNFGTRFSLGGFTNPYTGAFVPVVNGVPQGPHGPIPFPK